MKWLFVIAFLSASSSSLAEGVSGKIEVCRHPTITTLADKAKVTIQVPIFFTLYRNSYNGGHDLWIEINHVINLGAKPTWTCF